MLTTVIVIALAVALALVRVGARSSAISWGRKVYERRHPRTAGQDFASSDPRTTWERRHPVVSVILTVVFVAVGVLIGMLGFHHGT